VHTEYLLAIPPKVVHDPLGLRAQVETTDVSKQKM